MDGANRALGDLEADAEARPGHSPLSVDGAWRLILALRRRCDDVAAPEPGEQWGFREAADDWAPARDRAAEIWIEPGSGAVRRASRVLDGEAKTLLELHARHATRSRAAGHVVAVLGQSLDGFIATRAGHSRYINGPESLTHLHRVRALSDAVVIGIGTALADRPQLTTRHVPGPHAIRVVIDPRGRLPDDSNLLCDGAARTLVVRASDGPERETWISDQASALYLPGSNGGIVPRTILQALAARGMSRVLVEGGGITVGRFLDAGLIERLQLAVSPLIIGAGRPALPIAPADRLEQARRPSCSRHLLGEDVLFDLCFTDPADRG